MARKATKAIDPDQQESDRSLERSMKKEKRELVHKSNYTFQQQCNEDHQTLNRPIDRRLRIPQNPKAIAFALLALLLKNVLLVSKKL